MGTRGPRAPGVIDDSHRRARAARRPGPRGHRGGRLDPHALRPRQRAQPPEPGSACRRSPPPRSSATSLARRAGRRCAAAGSSTPRCSTTSRSRGTCGRARASPPPPLDEALAAAPPRRPALARSLADPGRIGVDADGSDPPPAGRPPRLRRVSARALAADRAAAVLPPGVRFAISCGGDLCVGSPPGDPWGVAVTDARTGAEAHRLVVRAGGIATSGIHARLWQRADGSFAHHVLDPSTGEPAWTGLVAATAVAGTALEAEVLAKMALLSGPDGARRAAAPARRACSSTTTVRSR